MQRSFVMSALLLLSAVPDARAQARPAPAVDLTAAWIGFADDDVVSEPGFGGAFRWYVSPRIAIGPELIYIAGDSHSHMMLTGNLTWDVLPQATYPKRSGLPDPGGSTSRAAWNRQRESRTPRGSPLS